MVKTLAPIGALAISCLICSIFPESTNAGPRRAAHVLTTSTTPTPARARKLERSPPTTTAATPDNEYEIEVEVPTAAPLAETATTILTNATAGVETVIAETAGEKEPFVHSFVVHSDIKFRYSRTRITSAIVNPHRTNSHEVSFNVTLPEKAFIFQFSMTVDGNTYDAYIDDRENAAATYAEAKAKNKNAGLAQTEDTRNAQRFTILSHVKASSVVIFTLTYEELLEHQYDHYEQVIHIETEKVRNSGIVASIADTRNITMLKAIGRQSRNDQDESMTGNLLTEIDGSYGLLVWTPNATEMGRKIPARFVLEYDIDRETGAGEILVRDGYFVHFFCPEAPVYPKHIIFVLDVSGSMDWGGKIIQLRQAMSTILDDLLHNHQKDYFNIITFSSSATNWNGGGSSSTGPFPATTFNIEKARKFTDSLQAWGGTAIRDALTLALGVAANGPKQQKAEPIIMFLTDGQGNLDAKDTRQIITRLNKDRVPIFSLAFGKDADYPSLKLLSLLNKGTARKIYQDADAALQLENFYSEIASPIFSGVTFNYTSDLYNVSEVTKSKFSRLVKGTELVVAGKILPLLDSPAEDPNGWSGEVVIISPTSGENDTAPSPALTAQVSGQSPNGTAIFSQPAVVSTSTEDNPIAGFTFPNTTSLFSDDEDDFFMERLWAYLTVKQLLDDARDDADVQAANNAGPVVYPKGEDPNVRARDLAVEYKFVTPLTSLVVVMEDEAHQDIPGLDDPTFSKIKPQISSIGSVTKSIDPLDQITWLTTDDVSISIRNATDKYIVARDDSAADAQPTARNPCSKRQTSCTHLRDCVLPEIKKDKRLYRKSYFCELRTPMPNAVSYAGICCPTS